MKLSIERRASCAVRYARPSTSSRFSVLMKLSALALSYGEPIRLILGWIRCVSADGRSPKIAEIGSPPTTSKNVSPPTGNREEGHGAGTGGLHGDSSIGEAR